MRVEVKYRPGHENKHVSAQVVHERIVRIQQRNNGYAEPKHVVNDARPAASPIHNCFTWDDAVAGELHRENEARALIRSVVTIEYDDDDNEFRRVDPAFVAVARPFQESAGYLPTENAMADPEIRASVVATQRAFLEGWVKRNRNITELAELAERVERDLAATAEAARQKRNKRRREKAATARP